MSEQEKRVQAYMISMTPLRLMLWVMIFVWGFQLSNAVKVGYNFDAEMQKALKQNEIKLSEDSREYELIYRYNKLRCKERALFCALSLFYSVALLVMEAISFEWTPMFTEENTDE